MRFRQSFPRMILEATISLTAFAVLVLGFVITAGGTGGLQAQAVEEKHAEKEVAIDNFSFSPATITVPVGTKVTWTNRDDIPHTVVSTEKKFKSSVLDTDQQFSFTFTDKGTYDYFCSLHPKMTGKVVVQ